MFWQRQTGRRTHPLRHTQAHWRRHPRIHIQHVFCLRLILDGMIFLTGTLFSLGCCWPLLTETQDKLRTSPHLLSRPAHKQRSSLSQVHFYRKSLCLCKKNVLLSASLNTRTSCLDEFISVIRWFNRSTHYSWWMTWRVLDYTLGARCGNPTLSTAAPGCCGLLHSLKHVCIYILRCNTYMLCMYESVRDTLKNTAGGRGGDRQWTKALHISWNAIWWVVKWDFASALHRWSHFWPLALNLTLHLHACIHFILNCVWEFIPILHWAADPLLFCLCLYIKILFYNLCPIF